MLSVVVAIVSCIASNLLIRYAAGHYTYNVAFILLMVECVKLFTCACVTRYINREQPFQVRWGFHCQCRSIFRCQFLNVSNHIHD